MIVLYQAQLCMPVGIFLVWIAASWAAGFPLS